EVILVAIRDRARFLKKYLAPLGSCLVFQLPTACAVGCILVPLRGYWHQLTERELAATRAPHSTCFFSSASKFSASSGVNRFKSTSRSFSSTGCERGVKIVNCGGAGSAPGVRCPVTWCSALSCSARTSRARFRRAGSAIAE